MEEFLRTDFSFKEGLEVFKKFSRNRSMIAYLERTQSLETLKYELQKLVDYGVKPLITNSNIEEFDPHVVKEVKRLFVEHERIERDDLPTELKILYDKNSESYKIMRALHEKMKNANSDLSRAEFRKNIDSLLDAIKKRWDIIDSEIESQGDKLDINNLSDKDKKKLIFILRSYISKNSRKEQLSDNVKLTLSKKVQDLISLGEKINGETCENLKRLGIIY